MGAGAFGTALSISYSKFHDVCLFSGFEDHVLELRESRVNKFCPEFEINNDIIFDNLQNIDHYDFDYIFWCFPVSPSCEILESIRYKLSKNVPIILCSKGLTQNNKFLVDEFTKILGNDFHIGFLAGPNFAIDLAHHKFSAADIGFRDENIRNVVSKDLSHDFFRLYPSSDLIGMQLSGAMKNVIAIACGITQGLSLGQNMRAFILTYGLREMIDLGRVLGANEKTFYGLSGMGDLVLTSSSETSRNMSCGMRIAMGESLDDISSGNNPVCEGSHTVRQIIEIAREYNVDIPICRSVFEILFNKADPNIIQQIF